MRRVWEWWTSTAYTRLEEGGAVVGMLTRWHQDDWAGRLLGAMEHEVGADYWEVVCFPAIWEGQSTTELTELARVQAAEIDLLGRRAGEALWPEKYNEEDLARIRANVGAYDWEALYQQSPYSRSMGFFKREWFGIVETGPAVEEVVARIRVWDKAGTKTGVGGDYAVGGLLALTKSGQVIVEHVERGQYRPAEREEAILRCARMDALLPGPRVVIWHQQDPGSSGLDSAQMTSKMLAEAGFTARFETVTGTKEVRAGPWSTKCQSGGVRLVRGGWNEAFMAEHEAFPKGKFDDQVDMASWGYTRLQDGALDGKLMA